MITDYFADLPDFTYNTFRELLESAAARFPDNTAVQMKNNSGAYSSLTYRQLQRSTSRTAAYLFGKGMKKGDHIGILSENRIEWCTVYLAAVTSGLVAVPFDITLRGEDIGKIAEYSDIRVLFYSEKLKRKAEDAAHAARLGILMVSFDDGPFPDGLSPDGPDAGSGTPGVGITGGDTASIIFTSGTTGLSKGVMLSHKGIIENINASIHSLPISEKDNFITVLPLHHTYPTTCSFLSPLTVGGTVTIAESLVGAKIIANVRETAGTIMIGVPLLYDKMRKGMKAKFRELKGLKRILVNTLLWISDFSAKALKIPIGKHLLHSVRKQAGLSSLRLLVAGGGPLKKATSDFFTALGFTIVQGYGMSENGPLITTNTERYTNNMSVGLPVKNTEIRIDAPNRQGIGEIQIKSPSLMKGYYKNPQATQEMFTADGFLKSGDLGVFDVKGYLYIMGRSKNLIVTEGGKNIYPEEIENYFTDSEVIQEIMITGRKTDKLSTAEQVIAVCVPDVEALQEKYGPETVSEEFTRGLVKAEIERVNRTLEGYKKITDFIIRQEPFEKTSSEKIKRYLYKKYSGA